MTSAWWAITTAVAFGQFTLWWPMYRQYGVHLGQGLGPVLGAIVQAVVLLFSGTSFGGVMTSLIAGSAVVLITVRIEERRRQRAGTEEKEEA